MVVTAVIAVLVSVVGMAITLINAWAQAEKQLGDLYDQMMMYRTQNPEVMRLSREWHQGCFEKVYGSDTQETKQWVIYYSYVELCLGYCNTVLFSRWRLPPGSYCSHHRPLVMLILTEHNPIIEELMTDKYLSNLIKDFRKRRQDEGWNWQQEHSLLAT